MNKFAAIILVFTFFVFSCGKKEEQQTQQQQPQSQPQQEQSQQPTTSSDASSDAQKKKEEEMKKEEEKKKEDQKKKKEEEKKKEEAKKKEEEKGNQETTEINFAPIFAKRCAKCHGSKGTGKLEGVPNLTLPKTQSRSEKEIFNIIKFGVKGDEEDDEDMPAWGGKLTDDEIRAAVKFVKGL